MQTAALSSSTVPYASSRRDSFGTRPPPTSAVVPSSPVRVYIRVSRIAIFSPMLATLSRLMIAAIQIGRVGPPAPPIPRVAIAGLLENFACTRGTSARHAANHELLIPRQHLLCNGKKGIIGLRLSPWPQEHYWNIDCAGRMALGKFLFSADINVNRVGVFLENLVRLRRLNLFNCHHYLRGRPFFRSA